MQKRQETEDRRRVVTTEEQRRKLAELIVRQVRRTRELVIPGSLRDGVRFEVDGPWSFRGGHPYVLLHPSDEMREELQRLAQYYWSVVRAYDYETDVLGTGGDGIDLWGAFRSYYDEWHKALNMSLVARVYWDPGRDKWKWRTRNGKRSRVKYRTTPSWKYGDSPELPSGEMAYEQVMERLLDEDGDEA